MIRRYDLARRQFDASHPVQNLVLRDSQTNRPSFIMDEYAVSSDGTRLAIVSAGESKIDVVDVVSGNSFRVLSLPYQYEVASVMDEIFFSHDDTLLVIRRHDAVIHYVADIEGHGWETMEVADFSLSNSGLLATLDSNSRRVTIRRSYLSEPLITKDFENPVVDLSLSGAGDMLLVGTSETKDEIGLTHTWYVLDTQTLSAVTEPWVKRVDGDVYQGSAWGEDRASVIYYNVNDAGSAFYGIGEREMTFSVPYVHPSNMALSPDGRWLAIVDSDLGVIDVHALDRTGEYPTGTVPRLVPRLVPQLHSGNTMALAMSHDARVVATVDDAGWISLWDRRSGRLFRRVDTGRRTIRVPSASAESIALSPDGSQVMASSAEQFGLPTTVGIWDVASGEPVQRLHDDINTLFAFLEGSEQALMCNVDRCRVQPLPLYGGEPGTIVPMPFGTQLAGQPMSLSIDKSYLALGLNKVNLDSEGEPVSSEASVGWMELGSGGRQGVLSIPGDNWVGAVVALDETRVAAGLFTGDVLLIDGSENRVVARVPGHRTHIIVRSAVALDDGRFVVGGLSFYGTPSLAIMSSGDFSMLQRISAGQLIDLPIDLLAVGGGRWVTAASSLSNDLLVWNIDSIDGASHIKPRVIPAWRVQFDTHGRSLLVDGESVRSLWDLEAGRVYHQFRHRTNDRRGQAFAALTDDSVVYLPPEERHTGLVIDPGQSVGRGGLVRIRDWMLLDLGEGGITMLSVTSGESIWRREDLTNSRAVVLTEDQTGVVVTTVSEKMRSAIAEAVASRLRDEIRETIEESAPGYWRTLLDDFAYGVPNPDGQLFVLDAETGDTRLLFENSQLEPAIPVLHDGVVRDVLRLNHSVHVERISLTDGSVMDATDLGISSLAFALSNPDGSVYLVADGNGQVALWDVESGERSILKSSAVGAESTAFSADGRVLATAETDGSVTLWDMSSGTGGVDRLASLVTFKDGDWAVAATDGRYDASDPADFEGLAWVMPDAPTEPVPLSVFYREYYEPRLLPRLLAGESFPEIQSIADRDRKQPHVEIVAVNGSNTGWANVTVEVIRGEAGGIGDLKLFRDGRLVGLDESAKRAGGERRDRWRKTFRNILLPTGLDSESVEFSAYAFNADGVKSDTARRSYVLPEVKPQPRRAFVVVVGVNAYENRSWDLHYAAEDARVTSEMIAQYMRESAVFDEVHTVSLIAEREDKTGPVRGNATRADLLAVLGVLAGQAVAKERLGDIPCELWSAMAESDAPAAVPCAESLSEAKPDDLVYLSFSGHGLSGKNGLFHLFLSDIGAGDRRVVNEDLLGRTLDSDELADYLRSVDAGNFVMVIDACNAAASVEGGGYKPGPMGSRGFGQLAYDKAMRVLAASQAEGVALESSQLRHGLLTYAMLREGLGAGAANRAPEDEWMEIGELLAFGVERVPLLYEAIRNNELKSARSQKETKVEAQRPSLFDFRGDEQDVRTPVLKHDDRSDG